MHDRMERWCIHHGSKPFRNSAPRGGYSGQGKTEDGGKETVNVCNAAKLIQV